MLFRKECIEARGRALGKVLLVRPVSFAWLTWMFGGVIAALLLFLVFFQYARKVEVSGILLPQRGLTYVVATQGGVVADVLVEDGGLVADGDMLFRIVNRNVTSTEKDLEGRLVAILRERMAGHEVELEQTRRRAAERLAALRAAVASQAASRAQLEAQIELQTRQTQLSESTLRTYKSYELGQYVSKLDVQLREQALLEQQIRLAELRRAHLVASQQQKEAETALRDHGAVSALEEQRVLRDIEGTRQQLAEGEARREILLAAPHGGIAGAVSVSRGETVRPGQTLMAIVPSGSELEVELYAPSRAIGLIESGSEVQLRYEAYPYQTFGFARGKVIDVALTAALPDEISPLFQGAAFAGRSEPVYRIRVHIASQTMKVAGRDQPLRAGSLVAASVLVERRPLIRWMLDPILARTSAL